jgi:hypothetical protein
MPYTEGRHHVSLGDTMRGESVMEMDGSECEPATVAGSGKQSDAGSSRMVRSWTNLVLVVAVVGLCGSGCQRQSGVPANSAASSSGQAGEHSHADGHDHAHDHAHGHAHEHAQAAERKGNGASEGQHGAGHVHAAGPHGGIVADWGGGKFHVELTIDHATQEATVYVLGSDEKTPMPVQTADGSLLLTINEPAFQVSLKPAPLAGESSSRASRYKATHDQLAVKRRLAGSIGAEVDGTPYAGDFEQ